MMKQRLDNYAAEIEKRLDGFLPEKFGDRLVEAMRYSLLSGGKRIRPALLLEFFKISGGSDDTAMPFACALEMIHAYSLIHDDLPCMDNDVMRRGKPCNHVAFGEATALLAGDALLNLAFETMLKESHAHPERALAAAKAIADASGVFGMCGGQQLDLNNQAVTFEDIQNIQKLKTGALFIAAAEAGCILAGAPSERVEAAVIFARNFGLVFQLTDDILDIVGNEKVLGKSIGKDAQSNKKTIPALAGLDTAKQIVKECSENAKNALSVFDDCEFLRWLTDLLAERKS